MAKSAALLRHPEELWQSAAKLYQHGPQSAFPSLEVPGLNSLFLQGLSRGTITEISGARSCGRVSTSLHILAQATARGEVCAVIDTNDSFHPASAVAAGICLERLVWVRCQGNIEHALKATDLLLHAGGFGVVLLDLCEASERALNRLPLSYWYRFRRAVENTSTILLLCADRPQAKSCSFNQLQLNSKAMHWTGTHPFFLLGELKIMAFASKAPALRVDMLTIQGTV